jgi:hypothetical protein
MNQQLLGDDAAVCRKNGSDDSSVRIAAIASLVSRRGGGSFNASPTVRMPTMASTPPS